MHAPSHGHASKADIKHWLRTCKSAGSVVVYLWASWLQENEELWRGPRNETPALPEFEKDAPPPPFAAQAEALGSHYVADEPQLDLVTTYSLLRCNQC